MARGHLLCSWNTRIGTFYIALIDGRFHPIYEGEALGSYSQEWQAAEDLAGGHVCPLSNGVDTGTLGIPEDVREWTMINPPREF
jgi:hypothetical protein